ncbi:MAG: YihY/virulence factor BrkB family protein [Gammaproteobacteria bacterium]|nr:YihY/virulence factor BrkB family protein [Gammaproteobacteria bacterium]MBU1444006.1 YihY/virulence factor BrkB family protein [Gammaproteobacteria bacterium]MBU2288452.1 YihY/virulence factor BrkB family protein [Gammaproteobacteria bacterium]
MNAKHLFDLCRKAVTAWVDDFAPSMGAAISYYTMFSLAPLLVIVIAVAGAIFGQDAVQGRIVAQLSDLVGREGAIAVQGLIRSASSPEKGLIAGGISIVVLIIGATTVFGELQSALDRIWHVPEKDKPSGISALVRTRILSVGLILGLAFLLMVSLMVSTAISAFGGWAQGLLPGWEVMLQVINIAISIGISTVLFAMIFKFMPTASIGWHDVWIGAGVTAVLFELGKTLIGLYLGKSGVNESYAAAGSVVVLLAWVYYAAQIFLLGAEFTKVYANEHGSIAGTKATAATKAAAEISAQGTDAAHVRHAVGTGRVALPGDSDTDADDPAVVARIKQREKSNLRLQNATNTMIRNVIVLASLTAVNSLLNRWERRQKASRAAPGAPRVADRNDRPARPRKRRA